VIDQIENSVLLIVDDALGERLAFHGEHAGSFLPDDVDGTPSTDLKGDTSRVNAQVECKVAQRGDPRSP